MKQTAVACTLIGVRLPKMRAGPHVGRYAEPSRTVHIYVVFQIADDKDYPDEFDDTGHRVKVMSQCEKGRRGWGMIYDI
jgi:hypothetical protein